MPYTDKGLWIKRPYKPRAKRSPIWNMPDVEFTKLVQSSKSIGDVLQAFGLFNRGRNHFTARRRIESLGLCTRHFDQNVARNTKRFRSSLNIFTRDVRRSSGVIRRAFIRHGGKKYECSVCGQLPMWNNLPLVLQVDHIDGDCTNNVLPNLRWICPNCHTQTGTFAGKKRKRSHP